ncbi:MAG: SLC13 family permease [Paludibacteraceae bacterium]|nr:SLC13 family permease [Paludibacteraceae bacterium]
MADARSRGDDCGLLPEIETMTLSAWITIVVALVAFGLLIFSNLKPALVFFGIMAVFAITRVMPFAQAFGGFASESVLLVGVLYIVIGGLKYAGALDWIVKHLMGTPKNYVTAILRLMLPVCVLSSVMSNTTTTALFKGVVQRWAQKLKMSPSKLLLPLAYAATIGGLLTLIGTPPNLIISSMYAAKTGIALNLFAPFPVAICCIAVDIVVVVVLRRLLPERVGRLGDNDEQGAHNVQETETAPKWKTYLSLGIMVAMLVASACNIAGFPLSSCALTAGLLMILTRCCTSRQAFKEVDWEVLIVFAGSVGLGVAIEVTGLAELLVTWLLTICGSNPVWVMVTVCVVSGIMTEIISDTACGAMFFPVVWQAAVQMNIDPLPMMLALMMSVSSSFSTPIATPPNLIVYNDGGYRFTDYARVGVPMKICHIATAIGATLLFY